MRFALWLAARLLPADVREDVWTELRIGCEAVALRQGRAAAWRWAWRQPWIAAVARVRWDGPAIGPVGGGMMLAGLKDDVRVAVRGFRRRTGLATAVIATVAISVGAIGAIASVIDAVLLRPMPYPDADRLVWLNSVDRGDAGDADDPVVGFNNPWDVVDWQVRNRTFDAICAIEAFDATILPGDEPVRVNVGKVSCRCDSCRWDVTPAGAQGPRTGLPLTGAGP